MQLSIIIVNYNVKYFLEQCLCSLKEAISAIDAEVLVVDNCSGDGSLEYLLPKFPWVQFIAEETNIGFAKANNKALQYCKGDYVLYLNPDTIIAENTLQRCLAFFKEHKDAGALGLRMIDGAGNFLPESKRAFPSPMVSFYKLVGLSALFPGSAVFNKYALGSLSERGVHEVDVLCGAFIMAERKLLQSIEGFDEAFFMYGEDIDLCYRIQKTGRKLYYLGSEAIVHFKGESSLSDTRKYVKMFYEAMFVFVRKHFSGGNAFLMQLFLQTGIVLRGLFSVVTRPLRSIWQEVKSPVGAMERNFILVGAGVNCNKVRNILEANGIISITESSGLQETGGPVNMVFCAGELRYEAAISFVADHRNQNYFYWHGGDSASIVGSADKHFTGSVYTC